MRMSVEPIDGRLPPRGGFPMNLRWAESPLCQLSQSPQLHSKHGDNAHVRVMGFGGGGASLGELFL